MVTVRVGVWWLESACVPIRQSLLMLCDLESHASSECLVYTFTHAINVTLCQYPVFSFTHSHLLSWMGYSSTSVPSIVSIAESIHLYLVALD